MNERYQILAALKGPALKCIVVFFWERRQLTVSELVMYVGHDEKTVRSAMRQLELYGMAGKVISSQETWHLTNIGYQLPLPMDQLCSRGEIPPSTTTTTVVDIFHSDQLCSSSSTPGEKFPPQPAEDAEVSANLVALHKTGIMGRKAATLARLEWVTPRYVSASHARWQHEGYSSRDTGLLIRYIEDGDPMPAGWCDQCDGLEGEHTDACPTQAALHPALHPAPSSSVVRPPSPIISAEMQQSAQVWQRALEDVHSNSPAPPSTPGCAAPVWSPPKVASTPSASTTATPKTGSKTVCSQ